MLSIPYYKYFYDFLIISIVSFISLKNYMVKYMHVCTDTLITFTKQMPSQKYININYIY